MEKPDVSLSDILGWVKAGASKPESTHPDVGVHDDLFDDNDGPKGKPKPPAK